MDDRDQGTLYQTFCRSVAKWGDRPAYGAPPQPGRAYHPDGIEYTYAQTAAAVEALRRKYAAAGYGPGHRIALLLEQRPEFFFHYYALNALGCSIVPINPEYQRDETLYQLQHSQACLAVIIASRVRDVVAVARELEHELPVVTFENLPDAFPEARRAASQVTPGPSTEAALLYTSGTTGRPKGCVLTNEYFHFYGNWYAGCGGRMALRPGEERLYNPLPFHHANAVGISSPAMLVTGGCHFAPDRFHASTWWRDLVASRITVFHYQGVIPNVLLKLAPCPEERQHQVRFGLGVGVDPTQHETFEKRFGVPLVEFWAMTETGRLIVDNVEPRSVHTRAFGRVRAGVEARVVDDNDRDVPTGQPGEMLVRHDAQAPRKGFFTCYLDDPQATETAWRGGWFHTGDTVTRDESGMLYFVDRKKNIIRRSGENVAAAEVEAVLSVHERVRQVAVLAVPDELREEEIMACIVPRSPADAGEALAKELFAMCSENLAYFKAPGWFIFRDTLPTTTTQKIRKVSIFPPGIDPRREPGALDFRALKKKPTDAAKARHRFVQAQST